MPLQNQIKIVKFKKMFLKTRLQSAYSELKTTKTG